MKKAYAKFYLGLSLPLLLFAAYFAVCAKLLVNAGEYLSMDETIARLDDTYGYYGPALTQRTFYFKEHLYRHLRPEAAALGSSRALQFRAESFGVPFANIGGMSGLYETDEIARALFAAQPPKLLILGVDFWWFNPANENLHPLRSPGDARMRLADLLQPPVWLATGRMTPRDAAAILDGDIPDAGISAILRKDGFDRFGAYYYTSIWNGERESDDRNFRTSLSKVKDGTGVFVHGDRISAAALRTFEDLLDFLAGKNIQVVLFLPPLAPSVLDAMEKQGGYAYMKIAEQKIRALAARRGVPFFDFHDLRGIGSADCEFTDGIHAGQVATDRMLLHMAMDNKNVRKAVKLPETALEITRRAGHASTLEDETDFLELGCVK